MNGIRLAILDLDGTIYRGSEVIPGAAGAVLALLDRGVAVRYLTNNSAARPELVCGKLRGMGVPCEPEWVFGSGQAAAIECERRGFQSVMVVGEPGLHETFAAFSLRADFADAVVVGICRSFTYEMMSAAMQAIRAGACFIATNRDATYPREGGRFEPGAGSIVAAIEACSGVSPFVVGKPEPAMILTLLATFGVEPHETVVVGDRIDTDVVAGQRARCHTWVVLTGVATEIPAGLRGSRDLAGLISALA